MLLEFSALLSKFIHEKDIKTYMMAQFCDIDRSTMYKYINGKRRPPSLDLVNKMADFMHLTPVEKEQLEEAYKISLVGFETYYRRRDVRTFLQDSEHLSLNVFSPLHENYTFRFPEENMYTLESKQDLRNCIFTVLTLEAQKAEGCICLLIPPLFPNLLDYLVVLGSSHPDLQIEHIFALNNSGQLTSTGHSYNLQCLRHILPLYSCDCTYKSYYYYDHVLSREKTLNLFPFLILTSECAVICSETMTKGILFRKQEAIRLFADIFREYRQLASPLAIKLSGVGSQLQYLCSREFSKEKHAYIFDTLPCLSYFIPYDFIDKYVYKDLPGREELSPMLADFFSIARDCFRLNRIHFIFSEQGIRDFLETGRVREYPAYAYAPFSLEDRILLLKKFMEACSLEQICMLRKNFYHTETGISIYVTSKKGYIMWSVNETSPDHRQIYLDIAESDLLYTFQDFCTYMAKNFCYEPAEALRLINALIGEYSSPCI